ncbi:MAG TPA: type II toxin-antitoxin system PemK/MazF family toxin [Thermomicrobiaceae bacterium]|nr:type II toxin-antitoxin system PemK/MazF family toxin [Thermomicrobiaceae bacterium]
MSRQRPLPNRAPRRGEIWWVSFIPVERSAGHEQAGTRPALIISIDAFNAGPQQLVMVAPLTRTRTTRPLPFHVWYDSDETGLYGPGTQPRLQDGGTILCDKIQTVSLLRFTGVGPAGRLSDQRIDEVDDRLRIILGLPYTA